MVLMWCMLKTLQHLWMLIRNGQTCKPIAFSNCGRWHYLYYIILHCCTFMREPLCPQIMVVFNYLEKSRKISLWSPSKHLQSLWRFKKLIKTQLVAKIKTHIQAECANKCWIYDIKKRQFWYVDLCPVTPNCVLQLSENGFKCWGNKRRSSWFHTQMLEILNWTNSV